MKHIIIGTAGHIDHGKTALIKALTGRDTDRLKEEKQRGITTDLGFTWFDLSDGSRCGIVDVPGHEKLVSNMAAGAVGMDLVLMVVAADEGIMPQTREHMHILELLGVKNIILVLTKCDLVDDEWLDMAEAEIREELKGTIMENAPLVRVSSVTGQGIAQLKEVIAAEAAKTVPRDAGGIPRLPIDRVFTMPGFGTVVTGTLLSGTITRSDVLEMYPLGRTCRIRGIQVHGRDTAECAAGQRTALNLADIDKKEIRRGYVIAPPGSLYTTSCIDVRLQILADAGRSIRSRERLHLYVGTDRLVCRAVLLDHQQLQPGESGLARLMLEKETVVRRGDRFVVRFYSPVFTVGGGTVLEPQPRQGRRFDQALLAELAQKETGSMADVCALHVAAGGIQPLALAELARRMACPQAQLMPYLEELEEDGTLHVLRMKREIYLWDRGQSLVFYEQIVREWAAVHAAHPYRTGIPKEEIRSRFMKSVKTNVFDDCLRILVQEKRIQERGGLISPAGFAVEKDAFYEKTRQFLMQTYEEAGFHLLTLKELGLPDRDLENVRDILRILVQEGTLGQVTDDVWTMQHYLDEVQTAVWQHFEREEVISYSQVRALFGTSRKCARMIIAYTDAIGLTRKVGAETERVKNY